MIGFEANAGKFFFFYVIMVFTLAYWCFFDKSGSCFVILLVHGCIITCLLACVGHAHVRLW